MRLVVTLPLVAALAAGCAPSPAELIPPGERALATVGEAPDAKGPVSVDAMLNEIRTRGVSAPAAGGSATEVRFLPGRTELAVGEADRLPGPGARRVASIMAAGTAADGSTADAALALRRARELARELGLSTAEVELGFDPGLGPDRARILWTEGAS